MALIELPPGDDEAIWRVWRLRPEQGKASVDLLQANWQYSALPTRVREAARTRVAQLNGCTTCKTWRIEGFENVGATAAFYDGIENWRNDPQYSPAERLAIELAERFSLDWTNIGPDFINRVREHFTDAEIVDLMICIGQYVAQGRLITILQIEEVCHVAGAETAAARPVAA
jgi:alkylhydroperoxidase family enzyme